MRYLSDRETNASHESPKIKVITNDIHDFDQNVRRKVVKWWLCFL